jgi:hypothetical protein
MTSFEDRGGSTQGSHVVAVALLALFTYAVGFLFLFGERLAAIVGDYEPMAFVGP